MPAISRNSTILVTGASGFIASHVAKALLDRGHNVIGTVRSASKGEYLRNVLGAKFSYTVVEAIEKPDAFREALKLPIDGVVHVASPVVFDAEDPSAVIGPAVQGTLGILEGVQKFGTNVKRVVLTSSTCTMAEPRKSYPHTFTEAEWNNYSTELVTKEGKNASGFHKYQASKVLAERAAWIYVENNKDRIKFDLVTLHPPETMGPIIHDVKDIAHLNATSYLLYTILKNRVEEAIEGLTDNVVDVRDAGLAHALALEVEAAGGERFILSNGYYTWKAIVDEVRAAGYTEIPETGRAQGAAREIYDGSKASRVLGLKYRPLRDTGVDGLLALRERFPGSV